MVYWQLLFLRFWILLLVSEMSFPVHKQRKVVPVRREGEFEAAERFLSHMRNAKRQKRREEQKTELSFCFWFGRFQTTSLRLEEVLRFGR